MKEEVKYWVITASRDHVKTGLKGGFAQACHGKSAPLKRMRKGDYVLYYSAKEIFRAVEKCQKFTAIGRVKDDDVYPFQMTADFCPFRRNIDFLGYQDVSIFTMINDLEFISNKKSWGYPFRYGLFEINQHDFDLISSQMLNEVDVE